MPLSMKPLHHHESLPQHCEAYSDNSNGTQSHACEPTHDMISGPWSHAAAFLCILQFYEYCSGMVAATFRDVSLFIVLVISRTSSAR